LKELLFALSSGEGGWGGEVNEFWLIKKISAIAAKGKSKSLVKGIGDDCAVLDCGNGKFLLVSTDTFNEGVHFMREYSSFHDVGIKSVSAGISDIYAMGGTCELVLIAISVPGNMTIQQIAAFYKGAKRVCDECGAVIAGGDTTSGIRGFSVTVTAAGFARKRQIKYRSGARPGDTVYLTGQVGYSLAGLMLLQKKIHSRRVENIKALLTHRAPRPFIHRLALDGITSMIDISDGLSSELNHLAHASGVKIRLEPELLFRDQGLYRLSQQLGVNIETLVLNSGEEYALLYTGRTGLAGRHAIPIGRVEKGESGVVRIVGNREKRIAAGGYVHCL